MINCNGVRSEDIEVLKYCNDVVYLDIGHSDYLDSIEVVKYMPKLKVCICVDSKITDLSPLVNCPDLEVLEIVYCRKLTDLSPLANCTKLKGINMSMAYGIKDITPLYSLENMERLYLGSNNIPDEMYEEACEKMPNCWVSNTWSDYSGVYRNYAVAGDWIVVADSLSGTWKCGRSSVTPSITIVEKKKESHRFNDKTRSDTGAGFCLFFRRGRMFQREKQNRKQLQQCQRLHKTDNNWKLQMVYHKLSTFSTGFSTTGSGKARAKSALFLNRRKITAVSNRTAVIAAVYRISCPYWIRAAKIRWKPPSWGSSRQDSIWSRPFSSSCQPMCS